jgi:acyl-CoA thioesterase
MRPVEIADHKVLAQAADDSGLARLLGMTLVEVGPGRAKARMTVTEGHLNFYGRTHGAALYALADHVCSVAGNSLSRRAVMTQSSAYFFGNPEVGQEITAEGQVTSAGKNLGHLEISVTGPGGKTYLKFSATVFFLDKEPLA